MKAKVQATGHCTERSHNKNEYEQTIPEPEPFLTTRAQYGQIQTIIINTPIKSTLLQLFTASNTSIYRIKHQHTPNIRAHREAISTI